MAEAHWESYDSDVDFDDDDISELPLGHRFDPTDQEILGFYLRRKATGRKMPPLLEAAFPTLVLFADDADPPWCHHPTTAASASFWASSSCSSSASSTGKPNSSSYAQPLHRCIAPRNATEWFYCFSRTTPRGPGSWRTTNAGTWITSGGDNKILGAGGETLGYKSTLAFKLMRPGGDGGTSKWAPTNWVMHQYKLRKPATKQRYHGDGGCGNGSPQHPVDQSEEKDLVLCRFRCTQRMGLREEFARTLLLQPPPPTQEEGLITCMQISKRQRTSTAGMEEEMPARWDVECNDTGSSCPPEAQQPTTATTFTEPDQAAATIAPDDPHDDAIQFADSCLELQSCCEFLQEKPDEELLPPPAEAWPVTWAWPADSAVTSCQPIPPRPWGWVTTDLWAGFDYGVMDDELDDNWAYVVQLATGRRGSSTDQNPPPLPPPPPPPHPPLGTPDIRGW